VTELRDYLLSHAEIRLRVHHPVREHLLRRVVILWPFGAREDEIPVLLMRAMRQDLAQRFAGPRLLFWLYVLAGEVVQLSTEWVLASTTNRRLMAKYHAQAS